MISVTIWDCTNNNVSARYNFFVDNNLTVGGLRDKIVERAYALRRNFLLYYGNNIIRDTSMELISFISSANRIGDISLTFTIYDENIVAYNVRVVRGLKIGSIRYVPLIMKLFSKRLTIELPDQDCVSSLKREIIKHFHDCDGKISNLVKDSLFLSYKGLLLDDDASLVTVEPGNILECIILRV